MKISDRGIKLIKSFEGLRLRSYKCPSGVWTIGYGHTRNVKRGQLITEKQAEIFLRNDLAASEKAVSLWNSRYGWNQNEFDALVSFTFNCGIRNLNNLLKNGKRTKEQIAVTIPLYNKSCGKVLRGLVSRRNAERKLFLKGV